MLRRPPRSTRTDPLFPLHAALPIYRAIAKEMQDRATAAGGHGQHRARAGDAGTAGRECRFAFHCPWAIGKQPPAAAAIVSGMDLESPCHRIAKQPAALAFEHHAVEERARIAVVQRKLPVLAAIFGSIDARGLARADGEHYCCACIEAFDVAERSEEHTSELQSLMRISYAVFCLKKKKNKKQINVF